MGGGDKKKVNEKSQCFKGGEGGGGKNFSLLLYTVVIYRTSIK